MNEVTITTAAQANEAYKRIEGLGNALKEEALSLGKFLFDQKEKVGHGNWQAWVKANLKFTDRTARRYVEIYVRRDELGWGEILALANGQNQNGQGTSDLEEDPPDAAVPAKPTPPAAVPRSATQALKKLTKPKQKPVPAKGAPLVYLPFEDDNSENGWGILEGTLEWMREQKLTESVDFNVYATMEEASAFIEQQCPKKKVPAPKASEEQQDDIWMAPFSVEKYPNTEGWNPGWNVVDVNGRVFKKFDLQEKKEAQAKVDELNAQAEADEDWFPPSEEEWKRQYGCKPPKDDFRYVGWDGEKYWVTDTVGSLDEAFDYGAEAEVRCVAMNATSSRGWYPKGWKAKKYYVKRVEGVWVVLHLSLEQAEAMGLAHASFETPVNAEEFRAEKESETP